MFASLLTEPQLQAARELRKCRPEVFEGTRAIKSAVEAGVWHEKVSDAMRAHKITQAAAVEEFCNACGVAD